MNPLQSGTPSTQLVPQNFQNSVQSGSFQNSVTTKDLLSTPGARALSVQPSLKLQVTSGPASSSVLGAADTPGQSGSIFLPIAFAVLCFALAIYFYRRYKQITVTAE